jgi:hypothetical protein
MNYDFQSSDLSQWNGTFYHNGLAGQQAGHSNAFAGRAINRAVVSLLHGYISVVLLKHKLSWNRGWAKPKGLWQQQGMVIPTSLDNPMANGSPVHLRLALRPQSQSLRLVLGLCRLLRLPGLHRFLHLYLPCLRSCLSPQCLRFRLPLATPTLPLLLFLAPGPRGSPKVELFLPPRCPQ